ncbi:MAG: hypothetical protein Fur0046_02430 [Cyanobacteria bacterium J069]
MLGVPVKSTLACVLGILRILIHAWGSRELRTPARPPVATLTEDVALSKWVPLGWAGDSYPAELKD